MSDPCPRCDETGQFNGSFCKACGYDLELEAADHAGEGADLGDEFSYEDFVKASGLQGEPSGAPWGWVLAVVLIGAALASFQMPGFRSLGFLFSAVLGVGVVVWLVRRRGGTLGGSAGGSVGGGKPPKGSYLCDRCKFDDVRYCGRPERPNATTCPDFKAR